MTRWCRPRGGRRGQSSGTGRGMQRHYAEDAAQQPDMRLAVAAQVHAVRATVQPCARVCHRQPLRINAHVLLLAYGFSLLFVFLCVCRPQVSRSLAPCGRPCALRPALRLAAGLAPCRACALCVPLVLLRALCMAYVVCMSRTYMTYVCVRVRCVAGCVLCVRTRPISEICSSSQQRAEAPRAEREAPGEAAAARSESESAAAESELGLLATCCVQLNCNAMGN
jgi:hypothetical protein